MKIIPNRTIQNTKFVCWSLYISLTTTLYCPQHNLYNIIHIIVLLSPHWKMIWLTSIPKHWKGGYHLLWCTHKPNMYQLMRMHGQKIPRLWQQVHIFNPCIHLVSTKIKPKLFLSLLKLHPTLSPLPNNIINYLISNPCKISLILSWLNSPNIYLLSNLSIIKINKSPLKASFPRQTPSVPYIIISWIGIFMKECILSVACHVCLTSDI